MVKPNITKHISYSSKSSRNLRWLYSYLSLVLLNYAPLSLYLLYMIVWNFSQVCISLGAGYAEYGKYWCFENFIRIMYCIFKTIIYYGLLIFIMLSDKNKLHLICIASNNFNGLHHIPRFIVCACKDILPSFLNPASKQKMLQTLFSTTRMSERWS